MSIFDKLTQFVKDVFKTNLEIFLEALQLSPNAQGYVAGSITELLLKQKLENEFGFEVKRIREKWEGEKHPQHHGDFYFRNSESPWFVMESKGVKSNSEKWHKLHNYENLKRFMFNNSDKIFWLDGKLDDEQKIVEINEWIKENLPKFQDEYASVLYDFEEIQKYLKNLPKRETTKSKAITSLKDFQREDINRMITERLDYVKSKIKVLETHFVAGVSNANNREIATPRKDEFNLISIDIFLRYNEHKFLFANPKHLDSSGGYSDHLQQNYIIGFVFMDDKANDVLSITEDWYEDLNDVYATLNDEDAIDEQEMQIDSRKVILINEEETD
jgi:hypothetical protein